MLLPFLLSAALAADPAPAAAPADFVDDVKLLYDVLACDGAKLPESLDPKAVEAYCKRQKPKYQRFVEHWGVPAKQWKKAGCAVETYGTFQKSFLETAEGTQEELRKEWASQPFRKLPMRFGYPDGSEEKRSHLMVARCEQKADAGR